MNVKTCDFSDVSMFTSRTHPGRPVEHPVYFPLTVVSESASVTGVRGEMPGAISTILLSQHLGWGHSVRLR